MVFSLFLPHSLNWISQWRKYSQKQKSLIRFKTSSSRTLSQHLFHLHLFCLHDLKIVGFLLRLSWPLPSFSLERFRPILTKKFQLWCMIMCQLLWKWTYQYQSRAKAEVVKWWWKRWNEPILIYISTAFQKYKMTGETPRFVECNNSDLQVESYGHQQLSKCLKTNGFTILQAIQNFLTLLCWDQNFRF